MAKRLLAAAFVVGALGVAYGADADLEKLKAAANEAKATLAVKQSVQKQEGREYQNAEFALDTGAARYLFRYKSFPGKAAADNPKLLNDWCSGYGMLEPHAYWYHMGFLSATVTGPASVYMENIQGVVRPLATEGPRVGYDLVFSGENGIIVIRTVALAGRDELFVSVSGKPNSGENVALTSTFRGYPLGFQGPFDRWLHGDGQDIQNSGGGAQKTTALKLDGASWLLLADHKLDPEGKQAGLLGLIYDRKAVSGASVATDNYSINVKFEGSPAAEQRFIVYTFGPMTWEAARTKLADVKDASELMDRAFKDLPPALEQK